MRRLQFIIIVAGLIALPASVVQASVTLAIQVTGLSFKYDADPDGSLFDATSIAGGNGNTSEATRVNVIEFFLGGVSQGSLLYDEEIYADFRFEGIFNIPETGGFITTNPTGPKFGFDLISANLGRFLALELDTVSVYYSGSKVHFTFIAGGPSAGVVSQNLPFGLEISESQPISVSVSSQKVKDVVDTGGYLSSFHALSGTASIAGHPVPEPASFIALLAIGLFGMKICSFMKRLRSRRSIRD